MEGLVRGCGRRVKGGVYIEVGLSRIGRPVEDFLLDPPLPVDTESLGMGRRGVVPIERDGVTHVMDWVGSVDYPNVADFVEEVRRFGVSRRIARTFDFSALSSESRLIVVHERASVVDPTGFYLDAYEGEWGQSAAWQCPKRLPEHRLLAESATQRESGTSQDGPDPLPTCIGFWWRDVVGGRARSTNPTHIGVVREMPSFSYHAKRRPDGVSAAYVVAAFASFPIGNLAVIRDLEGGSHVDAVERVRAAAIPVAIEDE